MPFEGVYCAAPQYKKDRVKFPVKTEDCLACAATRENPCNWTLELLTSLFNEQQDRGDHISATTLITKCLRSEFMQRRLPWYDHPEGRWAAFRGTMYHEQLEKVATGANIAEARYHATIEGLGELSGSPDLVDVEHGIIFDYKTNKENPRFHKPWKEHGQQVNILRWLVDHAHTVQWNGETYPLSMDAPVYGRPGDDPAVVGHNIDKFRPKEWTNLALVYMDDKQPERLEVMASVPGVKKDGTPSARKQRVPDIWSDEQAEGFIRKTYSYIQRVFEEGTLPPIPEDFIGWEHPLCNFCPVRATCIDLEYGGEVPVALTVKRPREKF